MASLDIDFVGGERRDTPIKADQRPAAQVIKMRTPMRIGQLDHLLGGGHAPEVGAIGLRSLLVLRTLVSLISAY